MYRLKDLSRMYRVGDGTSEFDDPTFLYHGSGAVCLISFFTKIFVPDKESFTTDIREERIIFILKQIHEGASPEKAAGIRADLLAFLSFIHYGGWDEIDWSYLFKPEDQIAGFELEKYRQKWLS